MNTQRTAMTLDHRTQQRGFSLVELMVAMALSLILLAGVLAIFASSKTTYETNDRLSRLQENGRFALDVIVRDLRGAGFNGCSKLAGFTTSLNNADNVLWDFEQAVTGFDGQGSAWVPALEKTDIAASSAGEPDPEFDAIAIRAPLGEFEPLRMTAAMTSGSDAVSVTDVAGELIEAGDVVQVSDCRNRAVFQVTANAAGSLEHGEDGADAPGNATADLQRAFAVEGEVVPLRTVVYYLAEPTAKTSNPAIDYLSLWRRVSSGAAPEEVVEGVESLQFQYGEDTNADNQISVGEYVDADDVDDWNNVLAVRVGLLVRSLSEYGTDDDGGTYQVLNTAITPAEGDRNLRQVFSTTVTLRNLAN